MHITNSPPGNGEGDKAERIQHAQRVKSAHEAELMDHPDVVGIGIGFRERGGEIDEDEVVIVVRVRRKKYPAELDEKDVLPADLDGVPIDVQEGGEPSPLV